MGDETVVPRPPDDRERVTYVQRYLLVLTTASVLAFVGMAVSLVRFSMQGTWTMLYLVPVCFTVLYFVISLASNSFTRDWDVDRHDRFVAGWAPEHAPTIDVFLPTCGEDLAVLRNTAEHVAAMRYSGAVTVYSLDDAHRPEVEALAAEFGFVYLSRPNRGWFKKAGNLRYGYERSHGEFVVVFDADFAPRRDFLVQLLPYFDAEPDLGIVQSPQYFHVTRDQNWVERAAGAVQELFYRVVQTSRQVRGAAICVGTNAIYRRAALDSNGGTTLIEHSEDVHTGFDLYRHGWRLRYVPLNLAAGICPSTLPAFFAQQYRWALGSMSLLGSKKFWTTRMRFRQRLAYLAGFMYYIETALMILLAPVIPLTMVYAFPQNVRLANYLLLVPAIFYAFVLFPRWHRCRYGLAAWSTRLVYGWAHLFAVTDKLRGRAAEWSATLGRRSQAHATRFKVFSVLVVVWGGGTALLWTAGTLAQMRATGDYAAWTPMLAFSAVYAVAYGRVIVTIPKSRAFRKNLRRREHDPLPPFVPRTVPVAPVAAPVAAPVGVAVGAAVGVPAGVPAGVEVTTGVPSSPPGDPVAPTVPGSAPPPGVRWTGRGR